MFNPFKSLFSKKNDQSVLGIDIGSSAIKVVQLKKKGGKAILETYGALALGPYANLEVGRATNLPIDKVVEALGDILKEAKTTTKKGALAIPFGSSLMSVIELPAVNPRQLAQIIPIEARKYIPVPISEVHLDWSIVPKDFGKPSSAPDDEEVGEEEQKKIIPKTDVLLVAIHNQTIQEYQDIVTRAGLDANFFEIEIFSTMRSVLDQNIEPIMILDVGAATTKLYIVERGVVRVSHTINKGSQDVTSMLSTSLNIPMGRAEIIKRNLGLPEGKTEKDVSEVTSLAIEYIFGETRHVLFSFQKKYSKNISKVVLVGGGAAMKGFAEAAQRSLETNVETGDPFAKVEAPAFLHDVLKNNGPEFAVAVGLALRRLQELN